MINLQNVSVTYPNGVVGLQETSIRFFEREVTVLLGLSGAGKSTLLRTLNHLTAPTTGQISIEGLGDLADRDILIAHRRRTAMIFQQHQLIPRHTALQNTLTGRLGQYSALRTFLPFPAEDRVRALKCLDRVGLLDKALSRADALSGGQQQRVDIARALAQEPSLILADEPVASLDPVTSHRVLSRLRSICLEDGIPAIVSLHQIDLAREFADRIVGLRDGRIVFDAAPDTLDESILNRIYGASEPTPETSERPDPTPEPLKEAYA